MQWEVKLREPGLERCFPSPNTSFLNFSKLGRSRPRLDHETPNRAGSFGKGLCGGNPVMGKGLCGGNPLKRVFPHTPFLNFLGYVWIGAIAPILTDETGARGRGQQPRPPGKDLRVLVGSAQPSCCKLTKIATPLSVFQGQQKRGEPFGSPLLDSC